MLNKKLLSRLVSRGKRARDDAASVADQQRFTSPALQGSAHPQSLPVSAFIFGKSAHTPLAAASSTNVPSASLNPNSLAQAGARHDDRATIQKGDNLGLQVLYEPPTGLAAIVDIVFVHGLTGNAYDTWFHRGHQVHWPSQLLKEDIPDARILSFGYDADIVDWWSPASINRIGNHAEALLGAVTRRRERTNSEQRKIVFVMHSLGGLVIQSALDLSRSSPEVHLQKLEANTIGLAFIATPHFGADIASWGGYGAKLLNIVKRTNKEIVRVLESDSEMLAMIQKKFHEMLRSRQANNQPIAITCFHEEKPFPVLGIVVEMKSAIIPGYPSYGIHATHTDMTKFTDTQCNGYDTVVGELQRWAKTVREEEARTTTLQEECLRGLYFDGLESREEAIAPALPGTFDWIWEEKKCNFLGWLRSGRGLYWISGRAASGKSTMMKHLFETSQDKAEDFQADDKPVVVAYFLDRSNKHPITRGLAGITRAILWQLLRQRATFFDHILHRYEEMKRSRPNVIWKPSELRAALVDILSHKPSYSIWLFLDALDEYSKDVVDIADFCKELATTASEKVRICVSSREEPEIVHTFISDPDLTNPALRIEEYTQGDIKECTARELGRIGHIVDDASRRKLAEAVSRRANGLFIWVRLVSRYIVSSSLSGTRTHLLLDCLKHLPQEINELYLQILERRDDENSRDQAELMLGIVACAGRSLSLLEFQFVLEQHILGRPNAEDGALQRQIDALAGGLLDYRTGGLVFYHETVSAFIRDLHNPQERRPTQNPIFRAHQRLAESCLLLLQECEPPPPIEGYSQLSRIDGLRLRDLRHYSILNWMHHWKAAKAVALHGDLATPQITNQAFIHWRRLYLARYWEQESTFPKHVHPATTSLELLILSIIPSEIFSLDPHAASAVEHLRKAKQDDIFDPSRGFFDGSEEWREHKLDILVSIEFGPGYFINVHARQLLVTGTNNMRCMITRPDDARRNESWVQLHLNRSPKAQGFENTIELRKYNHSPFMEDGPDKVDLFPRRSLLQEIKVLVRHNLQLDSHFKEELRKSGCVNHGLDRFQPGHRRDRFATPMHYAAFYGLTLLIEELYKCGADMNNVSKESCYGTPLLAAIWGLDELGFNSIGINTIKTLLRFRADPGLAGNGENLGIVTPLNAAVKLYTGYKRRVGFGSDNMKWVIELLLEEGAQADPATRTIARSSRELRRHFRNYASGSGPLFGSFSGLSFGSPSTSTPPIDIPAARDSYRSSFGATVGVLGPIYTSQSSTNHRFIQTVDDH